ncbi:poly [ADP-ribose] polymerase, partial [Plakobranchus ocellatus]
MASNAEESDGCIVSDSDGFESDGSDFYDSYNNCNETLHPLLQDDICRLKEAYTENAISYRTLPGISYVILDIHIPTSTLTRKTAMAWHLIHGKPVIIRLSVDQNSYLDSGFHKIEAFQESASDHCSAVLQLKNIAILFCQSSFRNLTNAIVASAVAKRRSEPKLSAATSDVWSLVEMGFNEIEATSALDAARGCKEDAINYLVENQAAFFDLWHVEEKVLKRKPISPCEGKEQPSLENGFLVQIYQYLSQRLLSLNDYCPICDTGHDLQLGTMIKPVICDRELCIFSFTTFGVMSDMSAVANVKVTDLLYRLTLAAANSKRMEDILSPYPTVIDPMKRDMLALHGKAKNDQLLKKVLNQMPPMNKLFADDGKDIQEKLKSCHFLCYPLLKWIIQSNRSHIVAIPEEGQLSCMETRHQFLMMNMPPSQEKSFLEYKRKYGSVFAFHGSPIENWHSIIREGLIVASGTQKQ